VRRAAIIAAAATLLVVLSACASADLDRETIKLGGQELDVWVAETTEQRVEGLQAVPRIAEGEGMLFVWDEPGVRDFELKSLDYAIDVVFVGQDGRVLDVDTIGPDGESTAASGQDVLWVVEVPGGWASANGVAEGSALVVGEGR
jgi:uncharacterized membrane protein (UPF0127 family)